MRRTTATLLLVPRGFALLSADQAEAALPAITSAARFRVQIPWNRDTVVDALHRRTPDCRATVFRDGRSSRAAAWLLTLYLRSIEGGVYSARDVRTLRVATLSEVFPPLDDGRTARYAVGLAAREARAAGASVLFVCAPTPALKAACAGFELVSQKSVYVTPTGLDPAVANVVSEPANWWCRALNEDQFEESYRYGDRSGALA